MKSENLNELTADLVKAQFDINTAHKNRAGYNYKYADIECVIDASRDQLAKHGLVITHQINRKEKTLVSTLLHTSGQWMSSEADLHYEASGKVNINQAMGAAITYARRYNILCLVNIAVSDIKKEEIAEMEEDDDGRSASPTKSDISQVQHKYISQVQYEELMKYWKNCSEDYRKTRTKILKSKPHNVMSLDKLPENIYLAELELAKLNAQLNEKRNTDEKGEAA